LTLKSPVPPDRVQESSREGVGGVVSLKDRYLLEVPGGKVVCFGLPMVSQNRGRKC
jgi:hypothetical protein